MNQGKVYLFAYGILMNDSMMIGNVPNAKWIGYASLNDHEREMFDGLYNVKESTGMKANGVLWEIGKEGLNATDMIEAYPRLYRRELKTVRTMEGQEFQAHVYFRNKKEPRFNAYHVWESRGGLMKNDGVMPDFYGQMYQWIQRKIALGDGKESCPCGYVPYSHQIEEHTKSNQKTA